MSYDAEKAFLSRKIVPATVAWEVIAPLEQISSPPLPDADASNIVSSLKEAFRNNKSAMIEFHTKVLKMNSKLRGGMRVVISVPWLRQNFASEIEADVSGGGRGLNPLSTRPSPRGGRGI